MAVCHGPHSPYGCGHHAEHVAAARLGWHRRRHGANFTGSKEQRFLEKAIGRRVELAHIHHSHPHSIAFREGGKWYELPRHEFRRLVAAGREAEREEARDARRGRQAERAREREERLARSVQRAEYGDVVQTVKRVGGIKLTHDKQTGRAQDKGEYELIPTSLRARAGQGVSMDRAREAINEDMPWLHLETVDDLVQFFDKARTRRQHRAYQTRVRRAS